MITEALNWMVRKISQAKVSYYVYKTKVSNLKVRLR